MNTGKLFYELFRQWPALALDLAGLDPALAARYCFSSGELKQTAIRLDGLLTPAEDSDDRYVFIEVQFQPDDTLYTRLFTGLTLFLHRASKPREWRVLVLYPELRVERIPKGYTSPVALPENRRVDLSVLSGQDRPTSGWDFFSLILEGPATAIDRAKRLIAARPMALEHLEFNKLHRNHPHLQTTAIFPGGAPNHARYYRYRPQTNPLLSRGICRRATARTAGRATGRRANRRPLSGPTLSNWSAGWIVSSPHRILCYFYRERTLTRKKNRHRHTLPRVVVILRPAAAVGTHQSWRLWPKTLPISEFLSTRQPVYRDLLDITHE